MWYRMSFYGHKLYSLIRQWERERQLQRRFPTAVLEENVQIKSPHLLTLGERVQIQKGTILHCGGMPWSNGRGQITIGDDSVISPYCVLYGAGEIAIGARFDCGPGCMIFSSRSAFRETDMVLQSGGNHVFAPVTIGDDVILFAGCLISPGVNIGNGVVVGAGSVVLNDLPANGVYAGVPARPIDNH